MDLDFMNSILDEVALEGLDGITLPMLWLRLENRPNFSISIDEDSKAFLWDSVAVHREIEIFELPEPRPPITLYNRYEHVDTELGIVLESPVDLIDIYPVEMVIDGNIRGSCHTYNSRKNITMNVRDDVLLLTLTEVSEKYGNKLVLVASPRLRLLSLIGSEANPLFEMSLEEYCLLERIGRSRYHGEVTQGEGGLLKLKAPFCKQLHYYRKKLTLKGFVTKQVHYSKSRKGIATTGSLFHLTRFYMQRRTKMELLMKCMCDILKEKPEKRETCKNLREALNIKEGTFKKLFHRNFEKWLKILTVPYTELNPQASAKESFTCQGNEKLVKVVQLLKHCDDEDNIDEEDINDDKELSLSLKVHFDMSKIYYNLPLILQIYRLIQDHGPEGMTAADLGRILTLPRLDIRTLLRLLLKKDLVVSVLHEKGRQKEIKYIARNFGDQNEFYKNLQTEVVDSEGKQLHLNKKRKDEECTENASDSKRRRVNDKKTSVMMETSEKNEIENEKPEKDLSSHHSKNSNILDFQKIVAEVAEIENYDAFSGKVPKVLNITETAGKATSLNHPYRLTHRKFKRISMVLEYLKASGFCTLTDLQKYLMEREKEEGYIFKVDKKSTSRMVHWLFMQKKLKLIKAVLKLGTQKTEIEFICDNSLKIDDPTLQPAIDQAKFKFFSVSKDSNAVSNSNLTITSKDNVNKNDKESHDEDDNKNKKFEKKSIHTLLLQKVMNELQVHPKFARFKTFHKFLYYLVYGYEGHSEGTSNDPVIYHDSMTWKRFVPPLPTDRKEGWCFLADIYNRIPLCVFVKSVNLRQRINEFAEYLTDEEKCHYLITHLPKKMLKMLLNSRKYIFQIDDVIKFLCYMGLVSYGPQTGKPKDQTYIYVHKIGAVKDTSISTPGYLHVNPDMVYEKKVFTFNTLTDVEKFWIELEHVSANTPLGRYSCVVGKTFAFPEARHKPELVAVSKYKNFDEISDVGFVPGDGLGAGGFDSSLFLHSRRNWQSSNIKECDKVTKTASNNTPTISMQTLLKYDKKLGPESNRLQRLSRLRLAAAQKDKTLKENILKKSRSKETVKKNTSNSSKSLKQTAQKSSTKKKIKLRTVKLRHRKMRTPFMDEKDKAAVEKMALSRSRADWTAQEDSFLLLCKVTSYFLDPSSRALVVPFTIVRDLLHEHLPEEGTTKTSRACQRRLRYMMMNPTTVNNVAVFLGEAKQDMQLVKDFDKPKPARSSESAWRELFTALLKRLLEKFTLPAADRCKNIMLPRSTKLFEKSFVILPSRNELQHKNNHKNPESEDEIKYYILYSLIVSSMALENDGTVWSYLLYKLYHSYPEYVLRSVISRLRSEKVIACKKSKCKKDFVPSLMTTFPYRFSITYENTMLMKFPVRLYSEIKDFLDKFKYTNDGIVTLRDDIPPGFTVGVLALVLSNEITLTIKIPDQVILFDNSLSKEARTNIVERMMHSLSDKDSHELARILNNEKDLSQNVSADEDYHDSENKSGNLPATNEIQSSKNASRFALYLLRQELSQPPIERVQHSQDYIILNSCQVDCHLKSTEEVPDNCFNNQDITCVQRNTHEPRGKILTDGCLSEIKASLCTFIPPGSFNQYNNFDEPLEMIYDAYSPQTLSDAKCIFGEILKAGSIGITEKVIWEKFRCLTGELSLFEHLHLFREAMLVIRAGVSTFLYVSIAFAKNWTLQSYVLPESCYQKEVKGNVKDDCGITSMKTPENESELSDNLDALECMELSSTPNLEESNTTRSEKRLDDFDNRTSKSSSGKKFLTLNFTEEVYFLPRTWRNPDGTLNKKALLELLKTVLSYIISSPGVSTPRVTERFSLVLQPVQTLELLEILEKGCCIVKYFCKKPKRGSLFSPLASIVMTKNPDPDDLDHFESLPDAVCNLTKIQEAIM